MRKLKFLFCGILAGMLTLSCFAAPAAAADGEIALRVANWEEYIDEGGWDDDEITSDLVFRLSNGHAHNDRTIYNAVKAVGKLLHLCLQRLGRQRRQNDMVRIRNDHGLSLPSETGIHQFAPFRGIPDQPLDRRGIRSDDPDDPVGKHQVSESDIDDLHHLLHVLNLFSDLFDLGFCFKHA